MGYLRAGNLNDKIEYLKLLKAMVKRQTKQDETLGHKKDLKEYFQVQEDDEASDLDEGPDSLNVC